MKAIKLPPADAYSYPYRGYKSGSEDFYKELKASKQSWIMFRKKLLRRQNFQCAYCLKDLHGRRMNVEHVMPIGRGGGNNSENLVAACPECNRKKLNKKLNKNELEKLKLNLSYLRKRAKKRERGIRNSYESEIDFAYRLREMLTA